MQLYLIRHTSVAIEQGICYGQSDIKLSESFEEDSKNILGQLKNVNFDARIVF